MRIDAAHVYRYTLPLTAPLSGGPTPSSERRGLVLELVGEDGAAGWGEAAPLPGFSQESVEAAATALVRVAGRWEGAAVPDPRSGAGPPTLADVPPSVQFAGESALLDLRAAAQGTSVHDLMGGADVVTLNALLTGDAADLPEAARRLWAAGYRTLKLKVGRVGVDEDLRRVHAVTDALGEGGRLRLDANRAWSVEAATAFAEGLGAVPLEYIEEPLADPTRLAALGEATGLPVAIDETTREHAPEALSTLAPVAAVVLKPTLLGGLSTVRQWVEAARAQDATPVLTGAYESGLGLRTIAALTAALTDAPAGLSTYDRLAADLLAPRLPMEGPTVNVRRLFESTLLRDRLTRIDEHDGFSA